MPSLKPALVPATSSFYTLSTFPLQTRSGRGTPNLVARLSLLFAFCLPFVCPHADGCCRIIAREIYGATDIEISEKAAEQMERFAPRVAVPHAKFSAILFSRFASYFYFFFVSDIHPAAMAAFPYAWRKLSTGDRLVPVRSVLFTFPHFRAKSA